MNPFHIGQSLTVQFGSRQRFSVAALGRDACLMRMNTLTPMTKWYSVADLLRWNPLPALPAPRFAIYHYQDYRNVPLRNIRLNDVLLILGGKRGMWLVSEIRPPYDVRLNPHEVEMRRWAQLQNIHTSEMWRVCLRWNGGGAETVAGRAA